jgi:hypothetical protein
MHDSPTALNNTSAFVGIMNLDAVPSGASALAMPQLSMRTCHLLSPIHSIINSQPLAASYWRYCDHSQLLLSCHLSLERI